MLFNLFLFCLFLGNWFFHISNYILIIYHFFPFGGDGLIGLGLLGEGLFCGGDGLVGAGFPDIGLFCAGEGLFCVAEAGLLDDYFCWVDCEGFGVDFASPAGLDPVLLSFF